MSLLWRFRLCEARELLICQYTPRAVTINTAAQVRALERGASSPIPVVAWTLKTDEEMDRVYLEIMKRGIAIQRLPYTSTGSGGCLRAVVFSTHTRDQIARLLSELKSLA